MQGKELKKQLKSLIQEASFLDPKLEKRLIEINRWIKDTKPGSLIAKKFLIVFLRQIIKDSKVWLLITDLSPEEKQQLYDSCMTTTEKYWYAHLFPEWLSQNDPKFYIWRAKLMSAEFHQDDWKILKDISEEVKQRQGTVLQRYVADLSMGTDLIISSEQHKPLCIQLTTLSEKFTKAKYAKWEKTLLEWQIDRGLFLSYNPNNSHVANTLVNIALYNSENLQVGTYLKFDL